MNKARRQKKGPNFYDFRIMINGLTLRSTTWFEIGASDTTRASLTELVLKTEVLKSLSILVEN